VVLSNIDRNLIQRCLEGVDGSWEEFVDRYVGLISYISRHAAQSRQIELTNDECDDLIAEILYVVVKNDYAALRRFKGRSSLSSYLTVLARRVAIHKISSPRFRDRNRIVPSPHLNHPAAATGIAAGTSSRTPVDAIERIDNREQIAFALEGLTGNEASAVTMFHFGGYSYSDISRRTGLAENSIGPLLARARSKMRDLLG
jgi:RNA polymerase sigma-70 factor (ECF subfamily)